MYVGLNLQRDFRLNIPEGFIQDIIKWVWKPINNPNFPTRSFWKVGTKSQISFLKILMNSWRLKCQINWHKRLVNYGAISAASLYESQ